MPEHRRLCLVRIGDEVRKLETSDLDGIDRLRHRDDTVIWLDLESPDEVDLDLLRNEFGVHQLAVEDLENRGQRAKLDTYGDQHVVVAWEAPDPASDRLTEMHLFAGAGYLVTVRWEPSPAVDALREGFARRTEVMGASSGALLYAVLDAVVDGYFPVIDELNDAIETLEPELLSGASDADVLRRMLDVKRRSLALRRVAAPLRDVANALLRRDLPMIDDAALPYYNDLYDHLVRVIESLDLLRELVAATFDASLAAANNTLNVVVRRLTALTVALMLPTLVAGIYGMNFDVMPELSWAFGYPFALLLMAAVAIGAVAWFRRHGWF